MLPVTVIRAYYTTLISLAGNTGNPYRYLSFLLSYFTPNRIISFISLEILLTF